MRRLSRSLYTLVSSAVHVSVTTNAMDDALSPLSAVLSFELTYTRVHTTTLPAFFTHISCCGFCSGSFRVLTSFSHPGCTLPLAGSGGNLTLPLGSRGLFHARTAAQDSRFTTAAALRLLYQRTRSRKVKADTPVTFAPCSTAHQLSPSCANSLPIPLTELL